MQVTPHEFTINSLPVPCEGRLRKCTTQASQSTHVIVFFSVDFCSGFARLTTLMKSLVFALIRECRYAWRWFNKQCKSRDASKAETSVLGLGRVWACFARPIGSARRTFQSPKKCFRTISPPPPPPSTTFSGFRTNTFNFFPCIFPKFPNQSFGNLPQNTNFSVIFS
jgi:hypothetical protein